MTDTHQEESAPTLRRPGRIPDILDVIAQLSNDEVPTPPVLARALLDLLPEHVWSEPDYRWLNPASKSGAILREVARRLMDGLAQWEPDRDKRLAHIMERMLYGCAITTLTGEMTRRSVYLSRDASGDHSAHRFPTSAGNLPFVAADHDYPTDKTGKLKPCRACGAAPGLERGTARENYAYAFIHDSYPTEEMQHMQFDVVIGNPPYQIGVEDNPRSKPLYQKFVENALALEPRYCAMITPSRWFTGGLGLEDFRARMIADRRLAKLVDNPKVFDCFPGVKIRGGVSYFLWDRNHDGDCHFATRIDGQLVAEMVRDLRDGDGVLVRDVRAVSVLHKLRQHPTASAPLSAVVSSRIPFGASLSTSFRGGAGSPFEGSIPVVCGSYVRHVSSDVLERNHDWVPRWKVLLPSASSGDTQQDDLGRVIDVVLGEPIALAPGSACSDTYLVAGLLNSRQEAENYAHYLATKFVRFLVLQRKATQHVTPERFRFVPALDMSRRWDDADLYAEFGLDADEIAHIEASIKTRSVNLSLDSAIPASHLPGGSKYRSGVSATKELPIGDVE